MQSYIREYWFFGSAWHRGDRCQVGARGPLHQRCPTEATETPACQSQRKTSSFTLTSAFQRQSIELWRDGHWFQACKVVAVFTRVYVMSLGVLIQLSCLYVFDGTYVVETIVASNVSQCFCKTLPAIHILPAFFKGISQISRHQRVLIIPDVFLPL